MHDASLCNYWKFMKVAPFLVVVIDCDFLFDNISA